MNSRLSNRVWHVLSCPSCGHGLSQTGDGAACPACRASYPDAQPGQLDLRLRSAKTYQLPCELGNISQPDPDVDFGMLRMPRAPEVDFRGVGVPHHLDKVLLSHFPKARNEKSLVLDLGCGDTVHRRVCEHAGFEYVGLDVESSEATLLGDAHALPFQGNSFEFVLSIAVLEHVQHPRVMLREAYRVLQPGGRLIGTVAFLEPFHNSLYHHTHLGTWDALKGAGFDVKHIAPVPAWSVLLAQADMALFPKAPRLLGKCFVLPLYLWHRLWWKLGYLVRRSETSREAYRWLLTGGAFIFIATKPGQR